jgi:hypothetical protein
MTTDDAARTLFFSFSSSSSFSRVPYKYGSERASEKRELLAERHTSSSSSSSRYIYFGFVTFAEDGQHSTPTDKRAATNCCRDRAPQQTGDGWGIISCREIWISATRPAQPSFASSIFTAGGIVVHTAGCADGKVFLSRTKRLG